MVTLSFFVQDHLYPVVASRGLIFCSWHCSFSTFMRFSACEGNIPLNPQLPANAHWLIWIWGEGNYAAMSLNLKPWYVCNMIALYRLLMAFPVYMISFWVIALYYSFTLFSSRERCNLHMHTACVCVDYKRSYTISNEHLLIFKYFPSDVI